MSEQKGLFLGRVVDDASGKTSTEDVRLDPDDLTTHGLIVGMTGSGKTALGIVLIEELLKKGIPVLAIDPKGDLGNLLLAFPSLSEGEFAPWVGPGGAAAAEAQKWRTGLGGWGLGPADVAALVAAREATVYTPGSTGGTPIDLLGSCAPAPAGSEGEEARELVTAFVSGLLGLVGIDADPVRSREHILLSRCVEAIHAQGKTATLEALIPAASEPPFASVGALPLESFFPSKARQELVLALNNLLASPATEAFRQGAPLRIGAMLGSEGGKARLSIVSIAHLADAERIFVVATLLSQARAWMRRQPGSSSLKAVIYVDEIFGFFPPSGEPPTKQPLLGLLKQARAFGLGVVLATQNPVDLDYKGLANCGCWWVGTLQAARDRERLQEGLTSASGSSAAIGLLNGTRKRVFLLHDVHRPAPTLVETRWAMSYLRGPMTKEEFARLKGASVSAGGPGAFGPAAAIEAPDPSSSVPLVPKPWASKWVDARRGEIARPHLLVRYAVRYRKGKASSTETKGLRLWPLDAGSAAEVLEGEPVVQGEVLDAPPARPLRYEPLPAWLGPAGVRDVEKALKERLGDHLAATLFLDAATGRISTPDESAEEFAARLASEAAPSPALATRLERKRRELAAAEEQEKQRERETLTSGLMAAADLLGGLLGARKSLKTGKVGTVLSKRRMETAAESKVESLRAEVAELDAQTGTGDPSRFQKVEVVPTKASFDLLGVGVAWIS